MKRIKTNSAVRIIDKGKLYLTFKRFWDDKVPNNFKKLGYFYNMNIYPNVGIIYNVLCVDNDDKIYVIRPYGSKDCYLIAKDGIIHEDDYAEYIKEHKEKEVEETKEKEVEETKENDDDEDINLIHQIENKVSKDINKGLKEIKEVLSKRTDFENAMIEGIIEKGKDISVEKIREKLLQDCDKYIEEHYGVLPKKIIYEDNEIHRESTGLYHNKFEDICKIIKKDIPLMLTGPAGAGKNYTVEQVAQTLGLDFYFTNSITQEYKLTGFIDANGTYHETEFYKAFTKGGIFFLDEVDASVPEALIILNSAIANRYFDFPVGRVVANENFRVVCAGNTYGTGADMIYVGRNVLDGATLDRFVCIDFDYDEDIEKSLSYDKEQYEFIKELRNVINENSLRYIISMRAIINSTKMLEIGFDKATILKQAIIKNMQIDDLNIIIEKFKNKSSEWYDELRKMCD